MHVRTLHGALDGERLGALCYALYREMGTAVPDCDRFDSDECASRISAADPPDLAGHG